MILLIVFIVLGAYTIHRTLRRSKKTGEGESFYEKWFWG
jgi:hypothetical protein